MPLPKRTAVDAAATDAPAREYIAVVVTAIETVEVDTFLVPLDALGADRKPILDMMAAGVGKGGLMIPSDPEADELSDTEQLLLRLGLQLGVVYPADVDEHPELAWQEDLMGMMADTKQPGKSYVGPLVGVLPLLLC